MKDPDHSSHQPTLENQLSGCIKTYTVARKQGSDVYDLVHLHVTPAGTLTAKALLSLAPAPHWGFEGLPLSHVPSPINLKLLMTLGF